MNTLNKESPVQGINKIKGMARETLLFDFYGALLTDKQQRVMRLYHELDMSLSEIAGELGISRSAVHDSLNKAEKLLETYEEKLGYMEEYLENRTRTAEMLDLIGDIRKKEKEDDEIISKLDRLESLVRITTE
jgi:predicted DNA-binding protein YlxM (UPF0122 family)